MVIAAAKMAMPIDKTLPPKASERLPRRGTASLVEAGRLLPALRLRRPRPAVAACLVGLKSCLVPIRQEAAVSELDTVPSAADVGKARRVALEFSCLTLKPRPLFGKGEYSQDGGVTS